MPKVITMGEALIDFVPGQIDCPLSEVRDFTRAAGGAPANVAVGLARLGVETGFMGKVGEDAFGKFLKKTLVENEVDTQQFFLSDEAMTSLAFVSLRSDGERDFAFYRNPGADTLYRLEEVDLKYLNGAAIFHFGSISLIDEPVRTATRELVIEAKKRGLLISFDPNIRPPLWDSSARAKEEIRAMLPDVDIVKVNEEELAEITGHSEGTFTEIDDQFLTACDSVHKEGPRLVAVTLGARGAYYYTPQAHGYLPGFSCRAIDTTGAGDGFVAGLLSQILDRDQKLSEYGNDEWNETISYANRVGAIASTKNGGIPSLPTRRAVREGQNLEE